MILPPDMVIFDCDGVIVDSEPITNRVMQASLARHGLALEFDEIMRLFVGGTMQGVMKLAIDMGAKLPDDWLDQIYGEMFVSLAEQVEPIPGIVPVLDALDAVGIPYAIGSNGPHAKMDVTLTRTGLKQRFEGRIHSREDVPNPKPAPDVYLRAAQSLGIAPERCAVIEDSA
ncbi:HAD family phosphatase, partial [Planktotalea sp.]|uniref:HAD family hydrolase n=1 Tax=Planktotalea sp. TaxID=2029877 RepID=UPI0032980530